MLYRLSDCIRFYRSGSCHEPQLFIRISNQVNTRVEYTDEKINKLVFELYGLGEEEIKIIEA